MPSGAIPSLHLQFFCLSSSISTYLSPTVFSQISHRHQLCFYEVLFIFDLRFIFFHYIHKLRCASQTLHFTSVYLHPSFLMAMGLNTHSPLHFLSIDRHIDVKVIFASIFCLRHLSNPAGSRQVCRAHQILFYITSSSLIFLRSILFS